MIEKSRHSLTEKILNLIQNDVSHAIAQEEKNRLLISLAKWQANHVPAYGRFCESQNVDWSQIKSSIQIPALPTDVFRFQRIASFKPEESRRVFKTSGTTNSEKQGIHEFKSLELYNTAAQKAARQALFPDSEKFHLIIFAPHENEAPFSSLSYMLTRFSEWFELSQTAWVWKDGKIDIPLLIKELQNAQKENQPIALLGTSFAFVHAEDALQEQQFYLPEGSRIMQTGGYKGKSRILEPTKMRDTLSQRYGLDAKWITAEYGMTELSSQMYEYAIEDSLEGREMIRRTLWVPHWVNLSVVSPETLAPVCENEIGVIRIEDLANVDSACAIQTSDMGRKTEEGVELIGRSPSSVPRGCSIAADAALLSEQ